MSQNASELDELLEHCRQGQDEAWIELVRQFNPTVARWLARLDYTLEPQGIEDLQQEVFRKVIHALPAYRGELAFPAWLYRQTESLVIDELRKRSAAKRRVLGGVVSLDAAAGEAAVDVPDLAPSPDELAASKDEHRLLFTALDRLGTHDSRCRQLIGLCYFGGFKYQEMAQALGMNAGTVSSALSNCLAKLRAIAAEVFPESVSGRLAT